MLDDVGDLLGDEAEVDRDEDAPRAGDAEQRRDQASGVVTDDGDPLAGADPQGVESGGDRPGPAGHLGVRQRAPRRRRLIRLVDDADPIRVEQLGPAQEVVDGQRDMHRGRTVVASRDDRSPRSVGERSARHRVMTSNDSHEAPSIRPGMTVPLPGPLHASRDGLAELADLGYTDVWSAEADGDRRLHAAGPRRGVGAAAAARHGDRAGVHAGTGVPGPVRRLAGRRRTRVASPSGSARRAT